MTEAEVCGIQKEVCDDRKQKTEDAQNKDDQYTAAVEVTVQNQGKCDTDDVIQIYIRNKDSVYAVKNPTLCAFQRVHVKAGEQAKVTLQIGHKAFTVVSPEGVRKMDGTHFILYAATFQPDERSEELMGRKAVEMELELPGT